ncbi:MAG: PIG-L family deacetylase [Catenulisporales bacterium]|jgi:LmbE family N-acetylglucosaminyl deacetylase|nr:PIG-L family deacetylase [Catenulisporales bacterium]
MRTKTIIAFHAHPDDEALLTGGTLARLAAEGHRTVIVVACDGAMGAATEPGALVRLDELRASARKLGVARVVHLGYADSGHGPILFPDPADRVRFVRAPVGEAAERLAAVIREEGADLLLSYDPNGGYGHRDHVRVHEVGARAAELTGVRVLEATLPREPAIRIARALQRVRLLRRYDLAALDTSFSSRADITHRIDVRRYAAAKQAALAQHRTQLGKGRGGRLHRVMAGLPVPLYAVLAGREWFVERPRRPGPRPIPDSRE